MKSNKWKITVLSGRRLDWVIDDIEMKRLLQRKYPVKQCDIDAHNTGLKTQPWSKDWSITGPLLEREQIIPSYGHMGPYYGATMDDKNSCGHDVHQRHESLLIAVTRVYVVAVRGEIIEIPDSVDRNLSSNY